MLAPPPGFSRPGLDLPPKKKTGPKLLGVGSYGCVYTPPLCTTSSDDTSVALVGKVSTPRDVARELEVASILRSSDAWESANEYFGFLTGESCPVSVTPRLERDCSAMFRHLREEQYHQLRSYSSPYLGKTLDRYKEPVTIEWIWGQYDRLLQGLALLHSFDIYHMDIKANNITIDGDGNARLIDFGLALINPQDTLTRVRYDARNPLFHSAYAGKGGPGVNNYYLDYTPIVQRYNPHFRKGTATDTIETYLSLASRPHYLDLVIQPNLGKVDLYRLSSCFSEYLNERAQEGQLLTDEDTDPFVHKFDKMLEKAMNIDVNCQWTLNKTMMYSGKHAPFLD